jgi:transposase-like protein
MNERKYRSYPEAFKLEALALLKQGEKSAGQIERELGITPGVGAIRKESVKRFSPIQS